MTLPVRRVPACGLRRRSAGQRMQAALLTVALLGGCAEIGSAPDVAAAIEMDDFPSPSVVIGDTLRNLAGVIAPVHATVRNVRGDVLPDAPVRYLYADIARDTALAVDSVSGQVRALKVAKGEARIAARVGSVLQVIKTLVVTTRPDSSERGSVLSLFTTTLADTGRTGATANTSSPFTITVRHLDAPGTTSTVMAWPVRFELLSPVNATNDTTKSVWLVDDAGRASVLDTTDAAGVAGRKVRVRALQYPAAGVTDTVVVRAIVTYRGQSLKGAPVRLTLPIKRGN